MTRTGSIRTLLCTAALALVGLALPTPALAAVGIESFSIDARDANGDLETRAGAYPYELTTSFRLADADGDSYPDEQPRSIRVSLPKGLLGDPNAVPRCTSHAATYPSAGGCPDSTQVGWIRIIAGLGPEFGGVGELVTVPVYNMAPPRGVPAQFAFNVVIPNVNMQAQLRPTDYGLDMELRGITTAIPLMGADLTLWGVPADPKHDKDRGECLTLPDPDATGCPSGVPPRPFLINPAVCGIGMRTTMAIDSWENPAARTEDGAPDLSDPDWSTTVYDSPQPLVGCADLDFRPRIEVQPVERRVGAPSGLEVDLTVPQDANPSGRASAHVKDVEVVLPEGVALNPSVADGLSGCRLDQIRLGSGAAAACPDASKIGTVEVDTPLLDVPLEGAVYAAEQGRNPFGSLLAIYVVAESAERGVTIKLAGKVSPDPRTGRLTTTFADNPQLPFSRFQMRFDGGARAPLTMPSRCGTYTTEARFRSWAAPAETVASSSAFTIDQGCGAGDVFAPGFAAGSENPLAGANSAFALRVTRADGEANVSRIEATLPEGLLAKLAGVAHCGDAAAATGQCPPSSQVGVTVIGVGAGSNPLFVPQPGRTPTAVYLAGPYKGAPYSLVVKVPAQAGPFDLGTVAVRSRIEVDPVTTRVSVSSDPLPQILEGIPLLYRDIRVLIDRPRFTLNPTSCDPTRVEGTIVSAAGQVAESNDRFQVAGCERLAFKPKLRFQLSGPTRRGAHPALKATLAMPPQGSANIGKAVVTLPRTQFLEQGHIRTICTRVQYAADSCPKGSVYGYAQAWTPLLDKPLQGPVYLRSSNNKLPDLVADLNGQIEIDLAGRIDSVKSRMRVTFGAVPDAPVSKFVLRMQGGSKGLLVNNTELCREKPRASAVFTGQNGKRSITSPLVRVGCGKGTNR